MRLAVALLIPLAAFGVQWTFWSAIQPYVWFLFFPAVFFSSWIGGFWGGLASTILSAGLVRYFFISPQYTFWLDRPMAFVSIGIFLGMGLLFSLSHERLRKANRRAAEGLSAANKANELLKSANLQVTRLYEKTREMEQLKTQFFANVSHELRTPLSLILGPVAKRLSSPEITATERADLEVVERNGRMLYRHVSDLLDVAKLEAGRMQMCYAEADLARMTRLLASHFDLLAGEKRVRYGVHAPDRLPVQIDAEKSQRMLLNLLSNAFKFTPSGGAVTLSLAAEEANAVIRVQDTGPGVPPELREAIFEPFRQVEGGSIRSFGGTGLGLAIVREFALLHRGSVSVSEAEGGGALFTLILPLRAPPGVEVQATASAMDELLVFEVKDELHLQRRGPVVLDSASGPEAPLVLVVEDNPDMNGFISENLAVRYRVLRAFDGEQGLKQALESRPDLIISDVMMPGMSGDALVRALRARREMDHTAIVMLTAKTDEELRVELLRAGVQDFLMKPFVLSELLARAEGILSQRRQAEAVRQSEAKFHGLYDSLRDGVVHWDMAGSFVECNEAYCQMLGYTHEELQASSRDGLTPARWQALEAGILSEQVLVLGYSDEYEKEYVRKDGSLLPVAIRVWLMRDAGGLPTGMWALARDMRERKAAEAAIERLNGALRRHVRQLEEANGELEAFSYSISHDLRAPLRAVDGYARILEEDFQAKLDAEGRRVLGVVRSEARRMGHLIDDLLKFSRLSRQSMRRTRTDMTALAQEVFATLLQQAPGRSIDFEVGRLPEAEVDEGLVRQVWVNLLDNAIKFTSRREDAHIEVGSTDGDREPAYFVRDNGAGFDMKYADKLFGVFQRLHAQEEFEGTGVGLALVQRIVHRHGGRVWAESRAGEGATFYFSMTHPKDGDNELP